MKVEVDLDRLKDFILWAEPQCRNCQVRFNSQIDCPQKSSFFSKNSCSDATIEYLRGEKDNES